MAPPAVATPSILTDAGYLFIAPLLSTKPTNTVAGSVFTDAWPAAWLPLGATQEGSTFSYEIGIEAITVAEFFDPIRQATVERSGSFAFNLASYTADSLSRAFNKGAAVVTATSGSGATALYTVAPPAVGAEVRVMLGWESLDNSIRMVVDQCINGGTVESAFQKAPNFSVIPCQFNFEVPVSGIPFSFWTAGVNRT